MTQREQVKLEGMMEQLLEMKQDITELKDRILDPTVGLIVETNKNTWYRKENERLLKEIPELVQFKKSTLRILWLVVTSIIALGIKVVFLKG